MLSPKKLIFFGKNLTHVALILRAGEGDGVRLLVFGIPIKKQNATGQDRLGLNVPGPLIAGLMACPASRSLPTAKPPGCSVRSGPSKIDSLSQHLVEHFDAPFIMELLVTIVR
jgi:hypothetical protein